MDAGENASDAAAARRERRRKRILENSEQRMKLILGQTTAADASQTEQADPEPERIESTRKPVLLDAELQEQVKAVLGGELDQSDGVWNFISNSLDALDPSLKRELNAVDVGIEVAEKETKASTEAAETRPTVDSTSGDLLFVVFGLFVRYLFSTSLGGLLLRNMILPFIILEVSMAQLGIRGDLLARAKNGLGKMASLQAGALSLAGVDPNIVQTYTSVLSLSSLLLTDFSLYFIAFSVAHLVMPVA